MTCRDPHAHVLLILSGKKGRPPPCQAPRPGRPPPQAACTATSVCVQEGPLGWRWEALSDVPISQYFPHVICEVRRQNDKRPV